MAERRRRDTPQDQQAAQAAAIAVAVASQMMQTPRGRRTLLILLVLAALTFGVWWAWQYEHRVRTPVGPTVRIATWNLHEFSPRPQIDLRRIAEIIQSNRFDLVALQEIRGGGEEVDNLLNVLGSPWRAAHYSPTTGNHERFVFIFNGDHVQEIGPPQFVPSPQASVFARMPYEDSFRAGDFQFTLITVHLEWTRKSLREEEARTLAGMAPQLEGQAAGQHLIVLGDFNEERQHGNLHYFEEQGWQRLIHDPTNLSSTEDFDNVLIDPKLTHEFSGSSGVVAFDEIYQYPTRHDAVEAVSDHRPAYADFVTHVVGVQ